MILLSILASFVLMPGSHQADGRIRLDPSMLVNETDFGDASLLVDEQDADEAHPPERPFFPGWTAWFYPVHVAIDLGGKCRINRISLYSEVGESPIDISTGSPGAWQVHAMKFGGYHHPWSELPINADTRWLRVTLERPTSVPELLVYGKRLENPAPKKAAKPFLRLPTMDRLMGVNSFIDDPIDKIAGPGGFAREYHTMGWDYEGPDGLPRYQPSGAAGGNFWFFDDYYRKLKEAGVMASPVVWQSPERLFKFKHLEAKPVLAGADPEDPASYRIHAGHLFQYAARYGSRKVADSLLDLAPGQPRVSGLGYLSWIENWNEPDKTWEGRDGRFNPYDLAAMSSADYDGDQGRMGKTVGVRNADPKMHMALGGITALDLEYLKAIKLWSDAHRGGSFPADSINVHHYSSSNHEQWFQPGGKGISPEADHLREKLLQIADWRDSAIPNREFWVTEFGYDTNPKSPLHVPEIGSMTAEEVQGAWLVREFLAMAAARVDRASMFMLRDVNSAGTGVFETCGIITEKGKWQPKAGWFYLSALKKHLTGYRFSKILSQETDPVWLYQFVRADGRTAVVAWCPTSEGKRVLDYRLPTGARHIKLVTLSDTQVAGDVRDLPVHGGWVTFDVSETPGIALSDESRR
jgi:hypothetical protein